MIICKGWLSIWVLLVLSASVLTWSLTSNLEDAVDLYEELLCEKLLCNFPCPSLATLCNSSVSP